MLHSDSVYPHRLQRFKEKRGNLIILTPKPEKVPHEVVVHGQIRVDHHHWIRLKEEQRNSDSKDVLSKG